MLCHVQQTWPASTWFSFNLYCHWKVMVLRVCSNLVHSKEEVTRGEPFDVVLYVLGVLQIVQSLKHHVDDTKQRRSWNTLQV